MGCCASEERPDFSSKERKNHLQFAWNTEFFQASNFLIDQANIKLSAPQRKLCRIVSKHSFPDNGKYEIKIRYVSQQVNSFSIGVFHTSNQLMTQRPKSIKSVGDENTLRLYVSKKEGDFRNRGETIFYSKDWRVRQQDTITMTVDMDSNSIEWKKSNTMDQQTQKTPFHASFINKKLYLELIMYQPDTQLNIQV